MSATEASALTRAAVNSMKEGEALKAAAVLEKLDEHLRQATDAPSDILADTGRAFTEFLGRRGYYVETPREMATSLEEIFVLGPGFDLYELARALARCDHTLRIRLERTAPDPAPASLEAFYPRPDGGTP